MELKYEARKHLRIPYNRNFYNLPLSHYESLCTELGHSKVVKYVRELIMEYSDDQRLQSKARYLLRQLDPTFLSESNTDDGGECECGFMWLGEKDQYECCPCCGAEVYSGKKCFYKGYDKDEPFCGIDGANCRWQSQEECGKTEPATQENS